MGDAPNDAGSSRFRSIRAVDDALCRLGTDHLDLLQLHAFDAATPVANRQIDRTWTPAMADGQRHRYYRCWKKAVTRSFGWIE